MVFDARRQLLRESGWDVRVGAVGLVLFFACMLALPASWFWFYAVPLAALWVRYTLVRCRRDEALLRADVTADGRTGAPGAYACDGGICISDGTHHVLVLRDQGDALLKLPHVR
jgi:hypothetical protein